MSDTIKAKKLEAEIEGYLEALAKITRDVEDNLVNGLLTKQVEGSEDEKNHVRHLLYQLEEQCPFEVVKYLRDGSDPAEMVRNHLLDMAEMEDAGDVWDPDYEELATMAGREIDHGRGEWVGDSGKQLLAAFDKWQAGVRIYASEKAAIRHLAFNLKVDLQMN